MTNMELLDRYEREYVMYHQISTTRWRQQRKRVLEFAGTLDGRQLPEARYADLQGYAGGLVASGLHVNTCRKILNYIRPVFSWMYAAGLVTADQYMQIRNVKDPRGASAQSDPKPYTVTEMSRFWDALDEAWPLLPAKGVGSWGIRRWEDGRGPWRVVWRHAMRLQLEAMIHLALDCGLRRSEIFRLELDDLHYDLEYLVVWRAGKGRRGVRTQQAVPMSAAVRQAVFTWVEFRSRMNPDHQRPWLSCYASTALEPMWWTRFQTLLQDTVGKEWAWHRMRHTCATSWLRAGMELAIVSRLLGHASLQQTMAYTRIVEGDIQKHMDHNEEAFRKQLGRYHPPDTP